MKNLTLVFFLITFIFFGCKTKQTIPQGKYVAGEEMIIIKSSGISFHIILKGAPPNVFWDRNLEYNVTSKGQIIARTMASGEYFKTLAQFDWEWNGKNIIKTSKLTGKKVVFCRVGLEP